MEYSIAVKYELSFLNIAFSLQAVLGKPVQRLAKVDQTLLESLLRCSEPDDGFKTVKGTTFCSDDFYEGSSCVYIWALICMLKENALCIISCLYFLVRN